MSHVKWPNKRVETIEISINNHYTKSAFECQVETLFQIQSWINKVPINSMSITSGNNQCFRVYFPLNQNSSIRERMVIMDLLFSTVKGINPHSTEWLEKAVIILLPPTLGRVEDWKCCQICRSSRMNSSTVVH